MDHAQVPAVSLPDQPGLRPNRACRNCVQIKAKCVPVEGCLSICVRCHRLGKECTTPAPAPRRTRRTPVKVTQLRQKASSLSPVPGVRGTPELPTPASSYDPTSVPLPDGKQFNSKWHPEQYHSSHTCDPQPRARSAFGIGRRKHVSS